MPSHGRNRQARHAEIEHLQVRLTGAQKLSNAARQSAQPGRGDAEEHDQGTEFSSERQVQASRVA